MDFFFIAGPCVIESWELIDSTASSLKKISKDYDVNIIFKSSYKKANRTSIESFTGIGDEKALNYLKKASLKYDFKVLTDVHTVEEAKMAAEYVDVLQIPAFLSRQTELLVAAGETMKTVNIKKGQFMSPYDMEKAANKVLSTGNEDIMLTERGTFFGYNDLVVDMRSLEIMKSFGHTVVYDATHSLQQPSIGKTSGGYRELIYPLARSAAAIGIDGMFFEVHPEPEKAKSDSATQMRLSNAEDFIKMILDVNNLVKKY